jgi:hypothetical protein
MTEEQTEQAVAEVKTYVYGTKSAAVREYMRRHPKATPKVIIEALAAKGLEIKPSLINNLKYGKRAKLARTSKSDVPSDSSVRDKSLYAYMTDLKDTLHFVKSHGGTDRVKQLLEDLQHLLGRQQK